MCIMHKKMDNGEWISSHEWHVAKKKMNFNQVEGEMLFK
jgi:hypothetical protein